MGDGDPGPRRAALAGRRWQRRRAVAAPGLSTDSGIPTTAARPARCAATRRCSTRRSSGDPVARHRYWARSYLGWRSIASARPNAGHRAVAGAAGRRAAARHHHAERRRAAPGRRRHRRDRAARRARSGRLPRLRRARVAFAIDARLRAANPSFDAHVAGSTRTATSSWPTATSPISGWSAVVPARATWSSRTWCSSARTCRGAGRCVFELVEWARALLVVGSSLTVMSGFRFARRAARIGDPGCDRQSGCDPRRRAGRGAGRRAARRGPAPARVTAGATCRRPRPTRPFGVGVGVGVAVGIAVDRVVVRVVVRVVLGLLADDTSGNRQSRPACPGRRPGARR